MPRADRARPPLHRPAAALQGEARLVRALPQGRAGARGLPDRRRASTTRCCALADGERARRRRPRARSSSEARAIVQVARRHPLALRPHRSSSRRRSPARSTRRSSPSPRRPRRPRPMSPGRLDALAEEAERGWTGAFLAGRPASASSARCAASSEVAIDRPGAPRLGRCPQARPAAPPRCSRSTASSPRFRRKDDETLDPRPARPARRGARGRPQGPQRCSATRASAR